jgi:hypothetical protein
MVRKLMDIPVPLQNDVPADTPAWATMRRCSCSSAVRLTRRSSKKYAETKDASLIWEGHKAGRHIGYCHIEKLRNLELLPSTGLTVSGWPGA